MATINLKTVDNKQLWQQMEPAPTASSALSAMTTSEDGTDRYIYYIVGALFYRYDTYANSWNKLAAPLVTPTVFASLRFSKYGGYFGDVISSTNNTITLAGLNKGVFDNYKINIISGKGIGQSRIITGSTSPTIYEQGLATTASTSAIGDSTKKWKINQWKGYQVRLIYSTGQTQVRKILYNDTTTLYIYDPNYQPIALFSNVPFLIAPVTTAGSQTHFIIESSQLTLDSNWTVNPDSTSKFKIESGGVWLLTSASGAPFYSVQYYDVASDYWINRTVPTNIVLAAFGTDGTLERTGEIGGVYNSGTTTSATNYTLTDTSKTFTVGQYNNYRLRIVSGTGVGQSIRILNNGTNYFEVARKWDITPSTDSVYEVIADKDKIYVMGNAQSMLLQYDIDSDLFIQAQKYDDGITNVLSATYTGLNNSTIAITSGVRSTGGITSVNATPTSGGSNYVVGDILTISTGGSNGKVIVESVSPGGIVTSVSLMRSGSGYTTGTGKSTTGGSGTLCTIEITSIGTVALITTAINHNFKIGETISLKGDTNYDGSITIIGSDSLTTFDVVTTAAGNMTAANSLSATQLVDTTKNWEVNEHVGKLVQCHLVGLSGAVTPRVITANTSTTLTFTTITTAPVNGTGRYIITDLGALGRDNQYRNTTRDNNGYASSGSSTTLVDSSKNWYSNQWAGSKIRIKAGTGRDKYFTITSNTSNTLTYTDQGFTPDSTTLYTIQSSGGVATGGSTTTIVDSTKNWATNQWAGKRVRLLGGAGFGLAASGNEITITSNTNNTLTFAAIAGLAPDTTTIYSILGIPPRSTGIELIWLFGGESNGKYLICPRGGATAAFDKYNILTEDWDYTFFMTPQTDTFTTGSAYAYDGSDILYVSPGVSAGFVQYIYYLDLLTNKIKGFGSIPNTQSTNVLGNRMEIIKSPQDVSYIYHMRNSATEMYRAMIWY